MDAIPTIDIAPFMSGDAAAKRAVADRVAAACREVGFLVISGHGIALATLEHTFERAFAFYAYLAAAADDATIAREAEALAREELRHAALLRTWRRAAWRRASARARRAVAMAQARRCAGARQHARHPSKAWSKVIRHNLTKIFSNVSNLV